MRGFVSSHHWEDYTDLIEGDFDSEEIPSGVEPSPHTERRILQLLATPADSSAEAEAPKELKALCLRCYSSHPVGTYRYVNDPIDLEDGTTISAEDWKKEAGFGRANRAGVTKRHRFHCPRCDLLTDHVAES